ncbi:unnamed protein product, partial [Dovyalis caffra]
WLFCGMGGRLELGVFVAVFRARVVVFMVCFGHDKEEPVVCVNGVWRMEEGEFGVREKGWQCVYRVGWLRVRGKRWSLQCLNAYE